MQLPPAQPILDDLIQQHGQHLEDEPPLPNHGPHADDDHPGPAHPLENEQNAQHDIPQQALRINHNLGDGELRYHDLAAIFQDIQVTPQRAAAARRYLNGKFSLDWAKQPIDFDPPPQQGAQPRQGQNYTFQCFHYLDYLHVQALPNRVLTPEIADLVGINLNCFGNWKFPFPTPKKDQINFDITGLTFNLASSSNFHWFIIMRPINNDPQRQIPDASSDTALASLRGLKLQNFVLAAMGASSLLNVGITPTTYRDAHLKPLTTIDFHNLQQVLVAKWTNHMRTDQTDTFWDEYDPCFHAVAVGPNIELPGNQSPSSSTLNSQITLASMANMR